VNIATTVSICSSVIEIGVAGLMIGLARAAGWTRARLFLGIALTAGAYSAIDIAFSMDSIADWIRVWAFRANYAVGGLHCAAWLVYIFGEPQKLWWGLSIRLRVLAASSILLGALALIPRLVVSDTRFHDLPIQSFGFHYRSPESTGFGNFVGLWFTIALFVPYATCVGRALRGDRSFRPLCVAFTFFWISVVNEVMVTNGVYDFLCLAEVGFLAIVIVVVAQTVARVVRDAQTLNVMSRSLDLEARTRTQERDDAREALLRAERAAALGRLARGAGHEIDNPLTCVHTNLEYVRDQLGGSGASEDLVHALDDAVDGALQIRSIVAELQAYAHDREGERRRVSLSKVVHSALDLVGPELRSVAQVDEAFLPMPLVMADRLRLLQVFVNLLSNASQAVAASTRTSPRIVTIRTRTTAAGEACAEITDSGDGILKEHLTHVAEPFFTTRREDGRAGLGLHIACSVIEGLGGRLEIESRRGEGTTVRVVLPNGETDDTPTPVSAPDSGPNDDLGDRARFLSLRSYPSSRPGTD
jgi:signal transduction histidine kinase